MGDGAAITTGRWNTVSAMRRALVGMLSLVLLLGGCGDDEDEPDGDGAALPERAGLLFVLDGDSEVGDGRVTIDADSVEWFTDSPHRQAGVGAADELVANWEDYGFVREPPNAAVSGDGEAVVELSDPRTEDDGVSFAYELIDGELESTEDAVMFIDSSDYDTDMHVSVVGAYCSGGDPQTLENPTIVHAPGAWATEPPQSFSVSTDNPAEVFVAADKSGSTNFEVTYEMHCGTGDSDRDLGTITMKGSVPDDIFESNSFSCSLDYQYNGPTCSGGHTSGFHVDGLATISDE